jgi:serine/threonine-protein kinase
MSITPGENIGPYRVIEQLGSGGMATVFKAFHASLDRYVAIKVLHPAFRADPQFFERFKREARIVAKLEHPNIIPVYDFNQHKGEPYLVMRFVEGDTLKPELEGKPMPPGEILRLMRPVCQALAYAHQRGVLHRDIKPSNIMVTREGIVFLTDFGLARMVQAGESTLSQDMMLGTPQYISPEQAQGISDLDGRTDIYSLGVVLFEMLTGRVPFSADTPFATVHDHIYAPLPLPSTINPDIDPIVERMLLKALAKEPDDRFATTDDLLESMEATLGAQIAATSTITETPTLASKAIIEKKKSGLPWWVWAGGAAMIIIALVGILAGLLLLRRANRNVAPPADGEPVLAQAAGSDQPLVDSQPENPPVDNQPGQPGHSAPADQADQPENPPPGDQPVQSDSPPPGSPRDQPPPPPPGSPNQAGPNPNSPEYQQAAELSRQATTAMQQQQFEEAADLFRQALETDPHFLPAYFGLSQALKQSGDEAGGLAVLEEAAANHPENPMALLRLGEAYLASQHPEAALETFEQAAHLAPDTPGAYAGQAVALLELDRVAEAKEVIDAALALDQSSPGARLANAIYLYKQGDKRQALRELQQLARDGQNQFVRERARTILEMLRE